MPSKCPEIMVGVGWAENTPCFPENHPGNRVPWQYLGLFRLLCTSPLSKLEIGSQEVKMPELALYIRCFWFFELLPPQSRVHYAREYVW